MPTFIGERLKISQIIFEKNNNIFTLNNVKITNSDLNDYCKIPMSKLCGRDRQVEKIDLEFESSSCEHKSLE